MLAPSLALTVLFPIFSDPILLESLPSFVAFSCRELFLQAGHPVFPGLICRAESCTEGALYDWTHPEQIHADPFPPKPFVSQSHYETCARRHPGTIE